ncbi:NACHT domain-containing protein [Fusarium keratoplasticum]|uniref:NACHT domain-containing protein n=1 Tax=Fusarium keratoplasticum TaxID=1328300 RepID=A0ACC0QEX5_9HYPO|nr:NACHT domain-containing protein [Fusarium keratoplasticum]KAI8650907.1 NACHT domain-containing protein [Fusarium keratoplasticum]
MADPLSMAASIAGLISLADTLFRHTYKFGRTATGAKKEIQALATEINSFSGILRNLEALADELEAEGQAFEPAFHVDHLIECRKIFDKIERQVTKALDSFNNRSRWEGISRQLKWPFSASDTRDLLQQLSRCKDSITLATSADTMRNLQLCLMKQREQGQTLSKMAASLEKIEVRTAIIMDPRKQLVLDFFMPPKLNPQANLDQSLKLRQPATGEWFTQSFAFTEWLQSPGSKLWLNGTAGGGKTVLAGAMIQEAIVRSGAESDVAVAFFFCDYKQEATLKSVNIIGALASQLAIQRDDSFDLLQEHYQELHPARGLNKPADVDELARVTASMCNLFSQVIIVVDGLDECGDAVFQALETLCDLADLANTTSMALLSRNEVEIRQALEGGFKEFIIEAREEDLKIYVRAEMEQRIRTKQLDIQNKTIKDEIQTELVSRANGMFRWVVCQLDYLGQLLTDADRRQALYELPPTLSETYLRLLQRINKRPPRVRKLVQKCLSFIAQYPTMPIEELCVAVSVPETIGARMDKTNIVAEREVALCCSSLIRKSAQDEYFEFAHFSVKEFLQDEMLLQTPELGAYRLVESEGRALIALQCLRFLQVGNIDDKYVESSLSGHDLAEGPGFSSFFSTASRRWLDLTRDGLDDPSLLNAAKSLFHHNATLNFRFWIYILFQEILWFYLEEDPWDDVEPRVRDLSFSDSLPPLHVASALNIPEICSFLIQAGARADASSPLGTPLLLAEISFLGFIEDLSGEYPDREWFYFEDILPTSSRRNNTIDCLISSGASFNDLEGLVGDHSVLLSVATIGCHFRDFDPFITLLGHGHIPTDGDITAFGDYLKTWPKSEDCSNLEEAILRLLNYLKKSSSYDLDWGFDLGNKIWLAAVTLGFDFTNDTSLTDSRISLSVAALVDKTLAAIGNDDTATLQLCLKDGRVNVNQTLQRGDIDGTLLHHAVAADALESTRLLLKLGGDPEARTNTGTPTLHCCDLEGDGSVLKLLVEHGLSLLAQSSDSGTLWHACASSHACEVSFVEALFNIDPECNQKALLMRTEDGFTPPMLALAALEDAPQDYVEQLESKALLFLHYCQKTPDFWDKHESLFMLVSRAGSKKVFQLFLKLNPGSNVIKPGDATPFHSLRVNPTKEWLEFLTATFPAALQLRYEDQLPLESYIERALKASKAPRSDVIQVLSPSEILRLKNNKGVTPWEAVCHLKDQARHWENKGHFLSSGWADLDRTSAKLLGLKVMEAYEGETGQCGVYLLLACSWIADGYWTVVPATLEQAIQSSSLWDPTQDVVVGYLKSVIRRMDTSTVQILTKYGTDVHQRENGTSPIEFACESEVARDLCSKDEGIAILQCLLDHSRPERIRDFSTDDRAFSILHRLAMESPPKRIEWLLRKLIEKGAALDAISPMASPQSRMSPLTWHLKQKSILCAEVLLELGADPLLTGSGVFGPADAFTTAVVAGSLSFLEKLHNLSVKKSTAIGWTRHIDGALGREMEKIQGHPYFTNGTLCHWACAEMKFDVVEFLLQRQLVENIDSPCDGGLTALHFAAMFNQVDIIEILVSHEASVNLQSDGGQTALHLAAYLGNIGVTRALLQLGAMNLADKDGRTASMLASAEGHDNIAEIVDRHFRSLNRLSPESIAPLVQQLGIAIEQGNLDECQRLFAIGCPLNEPMRGWKPSYPLVSALSKVQIAIAQWLLDNGASVLVNDGDTCHFDKSSTVVENAGAYLDYLQLIPTILARYHDEGGCWLRGFEFPLHYAAWTGQTESLKLILNYLAEHTVAISYRSHIRPEDVVCSVVDRKLGLRKLHPEFYDITALHIAVWVGNLASTRLLLENGADPDQLTTEGKCILDFTTDPKMTALLLQHGASPVLVLTDSFNNLLKGWGGDYSVLMRTYQDHMQIPGIELRGALDSSAPSFITESPDDLDSLATPDTVLAIASQGHGYVFNYLLWALPQISAFLLNSELTLETVQQFPWHWTHRFSAMGFLDTSFNQFRRRFGDRGLKRWLNLQPDRGWSPLCRAASKGSIKIMENCLDMGADLDFEGCPLGSALMIASACGRLEAVRLLVRRGATVTYNGRIGPINVFSVARSRKVKSWLLVGRFNDRLRLHAADEASTRHSNTQVSCWGGIVKARFKLVGWTARHGEESAFEYARRLCQIKRMGFTDGIVPADGFVYPQKSTPLNHSTSSEGETATSGEQWFHLDAEATSSESVCIGSETSQTSASAQKYEASCREVLIARGAYHDPGVQGFTVNIGVDSI